MEFSLSLVGCKALINEEKRKWLLDLSWLFVSLYFFLFFVCSFVHWFIGLLVDGLLVYFYLFVYVFYLFVYVFYLFIYLFVCLFIYLFVCLFISFCLLIYWFTGLLVYWFVG